FAEERDPRGALRTTMDRLRGVAGPSLDTAGVRRPEVAATEPVHVLGATEAERQLFTAEAALRRELTTGAVAHAHRFEVLRDGTIRVYRDRFPAGRGDGRPVEDPAHHAEAGAQRPGTEAGAQRPGTEVAPAERSAPPARRGR